MKRKLIIWVLIGFLLLIGMAGFALYNGYKSTLEDMYNNSLDHQPEDATDENKQVIEDKLQDPFVVLLYGIDQRENQNDEGRPDTLMLAMVDPEILQVTLISIPRDSYVHIPGRVSKDKINHSFSHGGVDLTIQTIEEWLDVPIDGYVAIDFKGFIELVDLVGGVDVYVDRSIQYDDPIDGTHIRLEEGQQVLDGKHALDFARARLDNRGSRYYTSDYLRMERQQRILKALGREIVSLKSITRVFSMMGVVGDNVTTTLTPKELDFLIRKFYRFDMENLETTSLQGEAMNMDGVWYEEIPQTEIDRIHTLVHEFIEREQSAVDGTEDPDESDETAHEENGDSVLQPLGSSSVISDAKP